MVDYTITTDFEQKSIKVQASILNHVIELKQYVTLYEKFNLPFLEKTYSKELFKAAKYAYIKLLRSSLYVDGDCSLEFYMQVIKPNINKILQISQDMERFLVKFKDYIDKESLSELIALYDGNKMIYFLLKKQAAYTADNDENFIRQIDFILKLKGVD